MPTRRRAIIWTNNGIIYRRIHGSLGPSELKQMIRNSIANALALCFFVSSAQSHRYSWWFCSGCQSVCQFKWKSHNPVVIVTKHKRCIDDMCEDKLCCQESTVGIHNHTVLPRRYGGFRNSTIRFRTNTHNGSLTPQVSHGGYMRSLMWYHCEIYLLIYF